MSRVKPPALPAAALWPLAIVGVVALLYGRVAGFPFLVWDDPDYVANNAQVLQGLTLDGVRWALTASHAANWHPLTWLSHMADVSLFGRWAGGHHLSNVVLHGANSVLLFVLLRRYALSATAAGLAALIFAVHPLHVESVAWVSERKDVLSGLFWLLTLLAYDRYVASPSRPRYLVVLAALGLGLLAKPMLITLPLIMLLLDYWLYRRLDPAAPERWLRLRALLIEKLPFALLCLIVVALSFLAQQRFGAVASLEALSATQRLETAALGYATYLRQFVLPFGLSYFYPRAADLPGLWALVAGLGLLAVTIFLAFGRGVPPRWRVGWGWFLISLLPVIGLVQLGQQAHADRYMYLPMIGLLLLIELPSARRPAQVATAAAAVALLGLLVLADRQIDYWRSNEAMYARAVALYPDNCRARVGLANSVLDRNDGAAAGPHIAFVAQRCEGDHFVLEAALLQGRYLQLQGRADEALALYQRIAEVFPRNRIAPVRAAALLAARGQYDAAADLLWPVREALLADQTGRALLRQTMAASPRYRPLLDQLLGPPPTGQAAAAAGR